MKVKALAILILIFVFADLSAQEKSGSIEDLEWILGTWERQNAKPGTTHIEKWWKASDHYFKGYGLSKAGSDTIFLEKLGIIAEEGSIYYVADVPENPEPVKFKFTRQGKHSFTSENPQHDAPKKIEYVLEDEVLTAKVSWDQGGFDIIFKKID